MNITKMKLDKIIKLVLSFLCWLFKPIQPGKRADRDHLLRPLPYGKLVKVKKKTLGRKKSEYHKRK